MAYNELPSPLQGISDSSAMGVCLCSSVALAVQLDCSVQCRRRRTQFGQCSAVQSMGLLAAVYFLSFTHLQLGPNRGHGYLPPSSFFPNWR